MSKKLQFSYWSDPLCIWAFVAQKKLETILEEHGMNLDVDYRIVPIFGSFPWRFREGPWSSSGVDGRVEGTRRVAAEHGYPEVTGEVWRLDTPASSWSPSLAIKAVTRLEREEHLPRGSTASYQWLLRKKFFVDNQNVCHRHMQLLVAEELGFERAALEEVMDCGLALADLWEDHHEKERLRLQGSPTFVFDGGRAMLYGNFSLGVLQATIGELLKGIRPGGTGC